MKLLSLFICLQFVISNSHSQQLSAEIIVAQEPICRTASSQTGKGLLAGLSKGGAGNVVFSWYDSEFNFIGNTPTINIHGPGKYHFVVQDNAGDSVLTSVIVDSINPIANFNAFSDQFNEFSIHEAYDSALVRFLNLSEGYTESVTPFSPPPVFKWNFDVNNDTSSWFFTYGKDITPQTKFYSGVHNTCLIAKNVNDCVDTICKTINIIDSEGQVVVDIITNHTEKSISLTTFNTKTGDQFHIYDIQGRLIEQINLETENQSILINFNQSKGAYLYSVLSNKQVTKSGKFIF